MSDSASVPSRTGIRTGIRKGILLAGGSGTRLDPLTRIACKQLLPVYDKPMVYYPLSTLMLGGIREILVISTPEDTPRFEALLGDGSALGLRLEYAVQPEPRGIAEAFLIGASFLAGEGAALILGDNLFYGKLDYFRRGLARRRGACIFAYEVRDPGRFGVVEFDAEGRVLTLEEKPAAPRSSFAVPGLYVFDERVTEFARALRPSPRGELEITDLNRRYLEEGDLFCEPLGRGIAWLDTGTPQSLVEAGNYIATIERQQNFKIGCIEEIAFRMGFVDRNGLAALADATRNPDYRAYLERIVAHE